MKRWITVLLATLVSVGCSNSAPPAGQAPDKVVSADVLRWKDSLGIVHNDRLVMTDPAQLAQLQAFFPDLKSQSASEVHGDWPPWVVVRLHHADGTVTYLFSEYRIYRIDDSRRGDFVLADGFADYVDKLFSQQPLPSAQSTPQ